MKTKINKVSIIFLIAALIFPAMLKADEKDDMIIKAMKDEIARSLNELSIESIEKPYYVEYKLSIQHYNDAKASLGALLSTEDDISAKLSVAIRIGSYQHDNSNFFDFGLSFFGSGDDEEVFSNRRIPIDIDYNSMRRELWLATDAAYKRAAEIYAKKEAALKNRIRKDTTHDYLQIPAEQYNLKQAIPEFNNKQYEELVRSLSETFEKHPEIYVSQVSYEYNPEIIYYVNSEGRQYIKTEFMTGLEVVAATQSSDGMPIGEMYSAYSQRAENLPSKDSLKKAIELLANKLDELREVPYLDEPYSGPVLFEDAAAAEIFAQVFAPNFVTQREPLTEGGIQSNDNYTAFQSKIGGRVLPEFLSVNAIPNKDKIGSTRLFGHYELDDEGVKPQDVILVKDGYLKNLLSSRVPTKRVRKTNGHNRGGAAMLSVIEMSSDDKHAKTSKELKDRMLKLCKDRELPYGIIVRKAVNQNIMYTGLYRITKGDFPIPFGQTKKALLEVYRIYPDGREELIRGCEAKGISVQSFKDIIDVGQDKYVHNYLAPAVASPFMTGGSSYLPVTVIIPDLLFEDGEITPIEEDYPKPPLMDNPIAN